MEPTGTDHADSCLQLDLTGLGLEANICYGLAVTKRLFGPSVRLPIRPRIVCVARRGICGKQALMRIRNYGNSTSSVVVLHGGPAASGDVAPVAQGLSDLFTVIEPWQRGSGAETLSVAHHVEDLHSVIMGLDCASPPALVGHSWGAMLALCYAATHPSKPGAIAWR